MSPRAVPLTGLLVLLLAALPAAAQQRAPGAPQSPAPVLEAVRITGAPPVLDGRLDDAAWAGAPAATGFVQRRPNAGAAATAPTEVKVLYTPGALYVAARMSDRPDSIAAQLARRDASSIYSDWAFVLLDSDNDSRSAYVFAVNPRNVQRDYILAEDGTADPQWDAVWEVKTAVDSAGWTAEFRIPLSQLRFDPRQNRWGVNFSRTVARREEQDYWSPTPPDAPGFVSRFGVLAGLTGLSSPTRLELRPYAMSRVTRAPGDAANPFYSRNEPTVSAGLDLRYALTPSFTLTATANPDFGQVEADPSVVNLTNFETSFSEQRPFFVEDASIFDFNMGGAAGQLFYSRRIGARPHGSVPGGAQFSDMPDGTTILGAAKVSGKSSNGWTLGVMDALTGRESARYTDAEGKVLDVPVEPLTNYAVARVIRDFRHGGSALGGIVTTVNRQLDGTGLDFMRSSAITGGVDGRHRFGNGNWEVNGYLVGSRIAGSPASILSVQRNSGHYFQRPDAPHLEVDSTATSMSGFVTNLELDKIGGGNWRGEAGVRARSPGVEINDFGFQNQTDRLEEYTILEYDQYKPGRTFRSWLLGASQRSQWTFGRERVSTNGMLWGSFQLKNFWSGSVEMGRDAEALSTSELRGGPALILPGRTYLNTALQGDRRRRLSWLLAVNGAMQDETDAHSLSVATQLDLRASPQVQLSLTPSIAWNRVAAQYIRQGSDDAGVRHYYFGELDQTTAALTARLSYTLTPRLSLQFYGQPFISAGRYDNPLEVADPRAGTFAERFIPATLSSLPDFNVKQFRSNAVLRWEYRPGSTLFVVWNSALSQQATDGSFRLVDDVRTLFGSDGTNTLLIKLSYWFGL
ncbi:MAG: DUF5916 domain-containing protein [Longimicrobiaceae bacterium]